MKKKLFIFIILSVLFLNKDVYASGFTSSIVGDSTFSDTITLEVKVDNLDEFGSVCNGLCGYAGILEYDESKIELTHIISLNGFNLFQEDPLVLFRGTGIKKGMNILSLTFKNKRLKNMESTTISIKNVVASDGDTDRNIGDILKTIQLIKEFSFKDVSDDDWFYGSIEYAFNNGFIKGYNDTTFAPYDNISRGQIVTILWRLENEPTGSYKNKFKDVPDEYYYDAILWASNNGVVNGDRDTPTFRPDDSVTRQELAVILNNYAAYKKLSSNSDFDLKKFKDYEKIADFAEKAIKWAAANRIMNGNEKDGGRYISPGDSASRAETAAMVSNFIKIFEII